MSLGVPTSLSLAAASLGVVPWSNCLLVLQKSAVDVLVGDPPASLLPQAAVAPSTSTAPAAVAAARLSREVVMSVPCPVVSAYADHSARWARRHAPGVPQSPGAAAASAAGSRLR